MIEVMTILYWTYPVIIIGGMFIIYTIGKLKEDKENLIDEYNTAYGIMMALRRTGKAKDEKDDNWGTDTMIYKGQEIIWYDLSPKKPFNSAKGIKTIHSYYWFSFWCVLAFIIDFFF